eukprot:CAMPEP_0115411626 /NCGR_PEP_ID=MMETSP0271-20121206/21128_1 /TAXON_ID=71861 /ORGANISM="Scrippsiella trochoidea, Strain CCMP3099" /LENGTH=136 /DNA_ID=CAMNT_0002835833 /DNA_START=56 /DNA_END=463 /DNA_ORIENTATION=-
MMASARSPMAACALLAAMLLAGTASGEASKECTGDACAASDDDVVLLQSTLSKEVARGAAPLSPETHAVAPQKRPSAPAGKALPAGAPHREEEGDTLGLLQSTFLKQVHAASRAQVAKGVQQKPKGKSGRSWPERK